MTFWRRDYWIALWLSLLDDALVFSGKKILLAFLSWLSLPYGTLLEIRNRLYDRKIFRPKTVTLPVISFGNISLGGTGKTSLVLWYAQELLNKGRKPVVLSRGYGRLNEDQLCLANNGSGLKVPARLCGDEPALIAQKLKQVPVLVWSQRARAAEIAAEKFQPDCILLDDGFQHRQLHRDLDILCLDERILKSPFLFPRGWLREKMSSLKRAHCFTVKTNLDPEKYIAALKSVFAKLPPVPFAFFRYEPESLIAHKTQNNLPLKELSEKRVLCFSAIAQPGEFEQLVKSCGAKIQIAKRFPDHHLYLKEELETLLQESKNNDLVMLTTEKDRVRLPADFPCFALSVRVAFRQGEEELRKSLEEAIGLK